MEIELAHILQAPYFKEGCGELRGEQKTARKVKEKTQIPG